MLLLMVLELLSANSVDVGFGSELLMSAFARTAVGFTTGLMMEFSMVLFFFTSL